MRVREMMANAAEWLADGFPAGAEYSRTDESIRRNLRGLGRMDWFESSMRRPLGKPNLWLGCPQSMRQGRIRSPD